MSRLHAPVNIFVVVVFLVLVLLVSPVLIPLVQVVIVSPILILVVSLVLLLILSLVLLLVLSPIFVVHRHSFVPPHPLFVPLFVRPVVHPVVRPAICPVFFLSFVPTPGSPSPLVTPSGTNQQAAHIPLGRGLLWYFEWDGSVRNWAHIPQERGGAAM